jgi:hypothetical protein
MVVRWTRLALAVCLSSLAPAAAAASTVPAASAQSQDRTPPPGIQGQVNLITAVPHSSQAMAIVDNGRLKPNDGVVALHRKAGKWSEVPAPTLGGDRSSQYGAVNDLAAGSASTIWAVGTFVSPQSRSGPAVWRWQHASWRRERLPHLKDGLGDGIASVAASSPRNAWAVGKLTGSDGDPTSLHWNGNHWSEVALPSKPAGAQLTNVSTSGAKHTWAVEGYNDDSYFKILHVAHGHWKVARGVAHGTYVGDIATTRHATYVLADTPVSAGLRYVFILKFDGARWTKVHLGKAERHLNFLRLAAHGRSIWVVAETSNRAYRIVHRFGHRWTEELRLPTTWAINAISAISSRSALAAGRSAPTDRAPYGATYVTQSKGTAWRDQPTK